MDPGNTDLDPGDAALGSMGTEENQPEESSLSGAEKSSPGEDNTPSSGYQLFLLICTIANLFYFHLCWSLFFLMQN